MVKHSSGLLVNEINGGSITSVFFHTPPLIKILMLKFVSEQDSRLPIFCFVVISFLSILQQVSPRQFDATTK
jgi:hypothetical protein